jgi:hypothetical protein
LELIIIKSCNNLPLKTEVSNNMDFVTLTWCLPAQFLLFLWVFDLSYHAGRNIREHGWLSACPQVERNQFQWILFLLVNYCMIYY